MLRHILFWAVCGLLFCSFSGGSPVKKQLMKKHGPLSQLQNSHFHENSAVGPVTVANISTRLPVQNQNPNFVGQVTHLPVKGHLRLNTEKPRLHTAASGKKILTVDAPMTGCPSLDFTVAVTVSGQAFQCILDTGSTTLAVASTSCGSACPISPLYSQPSTATTLSGTFTAQYGDGSGWTARAVQDLVSVGSSASATTIFASITSAQNNFFKAVACPFGSGTGDPNQGIIGFAFENLGASSGSTQSDMWFARSVASNTALANLFTLRMCLSTGDIWLYGYDTSQFSSQLRWTRVYSAANSGSTLSAGQAWWVVKVTGIGAVGGSIDTTNSDFNDNAKSIVDSGTSVAQLATTAYNDIVNAIGSSFSNIFGSSGSSYMSAGQCASVSDSTSSINAALPQVVVNLGNTAGGTDVSITLNGLNFVLQTAIQSGTSYYCPAIANSGSGGDTILGWPFINQLIVAHDVANLRIGFAPRYEASGVGCQDGSLGAVSVTGGDIVTDATGGNGQGTAGSGAVTTTTAAPVTTTRTTTTTRRTTTTSTTKPTTTTSTTTTSTTPTTTTTRTTTTTVPTTSTTTTPTTTSTTSTPSTTTTTTTPTTSTTTTTTTSSTTTTGTRTTTSTTPTTTVSTSSASTSTTAQQTTSTSTSTPTSTTTSTATTTTSAPSTTNPIASTDTTTSSSTSTSTTPTTPQTQTTVPGQTTTTGKPTTSTTSTTTTTTSTTTTSACANLKCLHGGTCYLNLIGVAECSCIYPYVGTTCQTVQTTGAGGCSICKNGGVPNDACTSCTCPAGFMDFNCQTAFARITFIITWTVSGSVTLSSKVNANSLLAVIQSDLSGNSNSNVTFGIDAELPSSWNGNSFTFTIDIFCDGCSALTTQKLANAALALNVASFSSMNGAGYTVDSVAASEAPNSADGCVVYPDGTEICAVSSPNNSGGGSSGFPLGAIIGIAAGVGVLLIIAVVAFVLYRRNQQQKSWTSTVSTMNSIPPSSNGVQLTTAGTGMFSVANNPVAVRRPDSMDLQVNPALAAYGVNSTTSSISKPPLPQMPPQLPKPHISHGSTSNFAAPYTNNGTSSGYYGQWNANASPATNTTTTSSGMYGQQRPMYPAFNRT